MDRIPFFQQRIEEAIERLTLPASPPSLYEPAGYMLSMGGKRIRPLLTLLGNALFDGSVDEALNPALAMEIFHNFTLVHDDLMDRAPLRRGKETVHRKWNDSTAILSGDVMLVLAYEKLTEGMKPLVLPEALKLFSETARKVCEGQEWDMLFEGHGEVSIDAYIEMIGLKTAALLAGCLRMGALVADASADDQALLYDFGYTLGIAFQLQDDILDAYGTEASFGKTIGGDIVSNKKTFLTLQALASADEGDREKLETLLSKETEGDAKKIGAVMSLYEKYGVRPDAEKMRDSYYARAMQDLDSVNGNEEVKHELRGLAEMLIRREK